MTEDIVRQYGLAVDHNGFTEQMELQRERSRAARGSDTALILQRSVKALPTKFVGYEFTDYESTIQGIFQAA
jgi:alanyl-tRNA synthetase